MKKKTIIFLLMAMVVFLLCACAASEATESSGQSDEDDTNIIDMSMNQACAYFIVFEELYEIDPGLNSEIEYIAFDLENVKLADTSLLIGLFQEFCDNNNYSLLLDNFEGLNQKGYIEDLYFPNGILIAFKDDELTEDTLVTAASKWRSGLGAIGGDYTVEIEDSVWNITKIANQWISR